MSRIKGVDLRVALISLLSLTIYSFAFAATGTSLNATPPTATLKATSKIGQFLIESQDLERDFKNQTARLTGQVRMVYKNQHFQADEVRIDQKKDRAELIGNVLIDTQDYQIGGEHIELDYISDQAIIKNGFVQSGNVRFQGQYIEKTSSNQFYVIEADFTTCNNCPATWSFDGSIINAELGGYAYIKNAFLKVVGVPIFWLPYLVLPLKNERQSGLLTPEIGFNESRGLTYGQSFFWAMSRSEDMTFTLKSYEHGGTKQMAEYRYAATDDSFGQLNLSHIEDSVFYNSDRYKRYLNNPLELKKFNRWSASSYFQHEISSPTEKQEIVRGKLQLVSDLQSPKDFIDEFKNYSLSGLENRLNYTKQYDQSVLQLDGAYYKHLLEANPLGDNQNAVHKLPELRFDSTTQRLGNTELYFKYGLNYANFSRRRDYDDISFLGTQKYVTNGASDPRCDNNNPSPICTPIYDEVFDEGTDIIRTGQRLNFQGALIGKTLTIFDAINIYPQLEYNETQYFFPVGQDRHHQRRYFQFEVLSRSKLFNIYESKTPETESIKYKHEFIPELQYSWIPWIDQKAHPFFGFTENGEAPFSSSANVSDGDLQNSYGLQFDYEDRIYDRHLITLVLLNRVISRRSGDASTQPVLDFKLNQSYDVYQASRKENNGQALSTLSGTSNLYLNEFTLSNQFDYYHYLKATNSTTSLTFLNQHQQYFKLGYTAKRTAPPNQDDVALSIGFVTKYLNLVTGVVFDASSEPTSDSRLKKHSLIAQFKPPGECWAINFYRDQKIGQKAEWKIKMDFSWDGKPPKVIPPNELNLSY
jgi:LPS-assembly protein